MDEDPPPTLSALLERLEDAGSPAKHVSIADMLQATGRDSFGALLLMPGLLVLSPLSGIPGLPTLCAVMVGLIALQLLFGRSHFWLPGWLLHRSAPRGKYCRAIRLLEKPAGHIDRLVQRRLTYLTKGAAAYLNAVLCLFIAIIMPPLELIPFANSIAGAALSILGLGMMARDGLMTLIALVFLALLAFMLAGLWM